MKSEKDKVREDINCSRELEVSRREFNDFLYAVSHDLGAPLRSVSGFSEILLEDYADKLDAEGKDYLGRIRQGAEKIKEMIDALLKVSRLSRAELKPDDNVNLTGIARRIADRLANSDVGRVANVDIEENIHVRGDARLLTVVLENLLGNAWKFTGKNERTLIRFGTMRRDGGLVYFVEDNGAGFAATRACKLFVPFGKLHAAGDFPGIGMGLATVSRVINRIGGRIWAESEAGKGATFYFTLGEVESKKN